MLASCCFFFDAYIMQRTSASYLPELDAIDVSSGIVTGEYCLWWDKSDELLRRVCNTNSPPEKIFVGALK